MVDHQQMVAKLVERVDVALRKSCRDTGRRASLLEEHAIAQPLCPADFCRVMRQPHLKCAEPPLRSPRRARAPFLSVAEHAARKPTNRRRRMHDDAPSSFIAWFYDNRTATGRRGMAAATARPESKPGVRVVGR
jgi:hypothetical protein